MSYRDRRDNKTVPPRWLHCPRKSVSLVNEKFIAFKTPLSSEYDSQVPEENRFTIDMFLQSLKSQRIKVGLWIDLTNTNRFYDKKEIEKNSIRYVKLQCRGHGETPSPEQTDTFVKICDNFIKHHPLEVIAVHCTHGFNRTGFLIVSYLVQILDFSLDAAIALFAECRPPGIYKGDYIEELYKKYDDVEDATDPPPRPAWCLEYDDSDIPDTDEDPNSSSSSSSEPPAKKRKREFVNKNAIFMAGVPGVTPINDVQKASGIQRRVQDICGWKTSGFPGSQPVSMDVQNIALLHVKPYRVSWKADGTRYMMLIQGDGEVYFIDRNNGVFQVSGLKFPHVRDPAKRIKDTLLDGEMVIDRDQGKEYPRYLAYDVIMYDGRDVSQKSFYPDRYSIMEREIIAGRHRAMKTGLLRREREPFSVRHKEFWDITRAESLLSEKFAKQLGHEPDGLIFQPAKEPYIAGPCPDVLKWKPESLNSIDFRLKIEIEEGAGIVRKKVGKLYVGGQDVPFGQIKLNKHLRDLNNKIIECKIENNEWVFMRERFDKSFPNSLATAQAVAQSILKPVTTQKLLDYISKRRFIQDDSELMPPPALANHMR